MSSKGAPTTRAALQRILTLALWLSLTGAPTNFAQSTSQDDPTKQKSGQPGTPAVPATVPQPQAAPSAPQPQTSDEGPSAPIGFESHGLEYEALTKGGVTVMFAPLPAHIKEFHVVQATVTNGSLVSWTVRPTDFTFVRQDGTVLTASSTDLVVGTLLQHADRNDVIKLDLLYENTIYALSNFRSTNGYEQRREAAMAQFVNRGFTAAAAASAIAFVPTKLKPGDSTDGAVFFENHSKDKTGSLGAGRLVAHTCGQTFMFETYQELKKH